MVKQGIRPPPSPPPRPPPTQSSLGYLQDKSFGQLAAPTAYDSSDMGEPCAGQIKLYVNKKVKYAAVRFPKSWIDGAIFPITLDPTVDYQVGAGGDDGTATGSDYIKYWDGMR